MYSFTICLYSLVVSFQIRSCLPSYYLIIFDAHTLLKMCFMFFSSKSVVWSLFFFNSIFERSFNFEEIQLSFFLFGFMFWNPFQEFCLIKVTNTFFCVLSNNFLILAITLRSMIHFEFIFVYMVWSKNLLVSFMYIDIQLFQHYLLFTAELLWHF